MSNYAWVTLTTNDTYSLGALVLAHSLKRAGTAYQLVVLVTPGISESMRQRLKEVYNIVQEVNVMNSQDAANLALLARPELGVTFTKLHCWRLVQFEKCVFLDSDALVLKNCDELFEREELSAAPDVSWPDCFNSGVFVYRPSLETFDKLTKFAVEHGSFDGGDQGLLNQYFADWAYVDIHKHLPFVYNVTAYASYCYLPAFKHFKDKIKILHFAGKMKPWLMHYNAQNKTPSVPSQYTHAADLIQLWWNIFFDNVHQRLNRSMRYYSAPLKQWKNNYDPANQTQQHQRQHHHQQQRQQLGFCTNLNAKNFNLKYNQNCSLINGYNEKLNDDTQANQTSSKQVNNEERKTNESVNRNPCLVDCFKVWQRGEERKESQQQIPEPEGTNVQIQNLKCKHNQQQQCDNCVHQQKKAQIWLKDAIELDAEGKSIAATAKANDFNSNLIEIIKNINEFYLKEDTNNYETDNVLNSDEEQISHSFNENLENCETNSNDAKIRSRNCDRDKNESTEAGLAGALSQLRLGEQRTDEQEAYDLLMRRQAWEAGQMDYTGLDSFDNIWKKIQETLQSKPEDDSIIRLKHNLLSEEMTNSLGIVTSTRN
ncbi:glycogenin-1 isoform X4 [Glossina fuscipes]|uniref:glycogenin glucosyltransferase n=1 Tax=Glossina fuscipes TaxID=7396 RepID=A0A9C6DZ10_9MUSC|nr:glycogenin-1 isoform X4 [Glossina fuscipes]